MLSTNKIIAANYLCGVELPWQEYLHELLENSQEEDIPVDFNLAEYPLPKQLKNSCVLKEFKDGSLDYQSSQIWLAIDDGGNRRIIEPKETSGVLIEGDTGKIIKAFNGLPEITPDKTEKLIRILIRKEDSGTPIMRWRLYSNTLS